MTGQRNDERGANPMHLSDEDLLLHYYRELELAERARAVHHLAECPVCREQLARLEQVLAAVDEGPDVEVPAGLDARVWSRLEPHVRVVSAKPFSIFGSPRWAFGFPRWAAVGLAATLVAAFLAGWLVRGRGVPADSPAATVVAEAPAVRERVVLVAVGEHLDRSQMILVELLNAPPDARQVLAAERGRATDLVAANRLYRQTAEQVGDEALGEVLGDLERVLVEIANSPTELSARELERLRSRIEAHGILFRVRVMSSEVRTREAAGRPEL